jgi:hypothetical protein
MRWLGIRIGDHDSKVRHIRTKAKLNLRKNLELVNQLRARASEFIVSGGRRHLLHRCVGS